MFQKNTKMREDIICVVVEIETFGLLARDDFEWPNTCKIGHLFQIVHFVIQKNQDAELVI